MKSIYTDSTTAASYIVRIYRRGGKGDGLVGTVHAADSDEAHAQTFRDDEELWAVLAGKNTGQSKGGAETGGDQR